MTGSGPEHIAALIERIGRLLSADAHAARLAPVQWEALRYLGRANRFSRPHETAYRWAPRPRAGPRAPTQSFLRLA